MARFGERRKRTVVTIGNFDGMHRGHQEILRRVIQDARLGRHMATVLTLFPHPVRVLRPGVAPALLMTLDQRLAAFDEAGIDAALVLAFNSALSELQPAKTSARHIWWTACAREKCWWERTFDLAIGSRAM